MACWISVAYAATSGAGCLVAGRRGGPPSSRGLSLDDSRENAKAITNNTEVNWGLIFSC